MSLKVQNPRKCVLKRLSRRKKLLRLGVSQEFKVTKERDYPAYVQNAMDKLRRNEFIGSECKEERVKREESCIEV